jgi:hypothetical protein
VATTTNALRLMQLVGFDIDPAPAASGAEERPSHGPAAEVSHRGD